MNQFATQRDNVIAEIERKALGELDSYVYSIGLSSAHRSQSIWIKQMPDIYAGRVIIELIQNGHDAHAPERNDGRIQIELAVDEGPFGTLYVANDGNPFRPKDFHSICDIGLSSKPPGEGIGNKGQGFRSVLSVSSVPEVYSALSSTPVEDRFHGFCFGFARPYDYRRILEKLGRSDLVERAIKEKSPYSVPVPLFEQPDRVKEFAVAGFSTVIRLPLISEKAFEDIRDQIKSLIVEDTAPIVLFLSRVNSIVVKEIKTDEVLTDLVISKSVTPEIIGTSTNELRFELGSIPNHGKYLIASAPIDHSQLMVKIEESLAYGLPTSWLEWTSEARVEIAVRLDRHEDGPRFYNFLPMGEDATAPFVGHINAPFYTKASREDLRLEIPINSFFLGEAGKLCARAILELSTSDKSYAPTAATDFLTWTGKYYEVIEGGFQSSGTNIRNAEIVPLSQSQNGTSWSSLSSTYRWNSDGLKIITTRQVCQSAGAAIVTDELGLERIERLQKFAEQFFSVGIEPPAELIADWIEKIAKKLAKKSVAHTTWEKFYDDVARCLTSRSDALKGRYILLSDDSRLLPCGEQKVKGPSKRKSIVFFQPGSARDDTDIEGAREPTLKVPASLNRYFSFIHPALRWHSQIGRRRTNKPSLNFFRDERLIQPYNVAAILESIAELLNHTRSDTVRREALIWAFRNRKLLAQSESPNLNEVNLRVPATKNWILANEAFFSGDWDTLQGKRLEALLRETERFSQDLQLLKDRLLASLKDWDLPGDTADWKEFLLEIGVRDGIWPIPIGRENVAYKGNSLTPRHVGLYLGLREDDLSQFSTEAQSTINPARYPYTGYRFSDRFWKLPGQGDLTKFSTSARTNYTHLILSNLSNWPLNSFHTEVRIPGRSTSKQDSQTWPTPLLTFLRQADWLTIKSVGDKLQTNFARPSEAWHYLPTDDVPPHFAPLITYEMRRLINGSTSCLDRMRDLAKVAVWNDPSFSPRLIRLLAQLLDSGEIADAQADAFRKAYSSAWHNIIEEGLEQQIANMPNEDMLVIMQERKLRCIPLGKVRRGPDSIRIFIKDTAERVRVRLLEALGYPVLDLNPKIGMSVATTLYELLDLNVVRISEVELSVLVDGHAVEPEPELPRLVDHYGRWLRKLMTLTIEQTGQLASQRSTRYRETLLSRLEQIRIVLGEHILLEIEGRTSELPGSAAGSVAIFHDSYPVIAIRSDESGNAWNELQITADAIGQLMRNQLLGVNLELFIGRLRQLPWVDPLVGPDDNALATAFNILPADVREILRGLDFGASNLIEKLIPVIAWVFGTEAAKEFSLDNEKLQSKEDILAYLQGTGLNLPWPITHLIEKAEQSGDYFDLRDTLDISFADFNQVLITLGTPFRPEHNRQGHQQSFASYIETHREEVIDQLRVLYSNTFNAGDPLDDYIQFRSLLTSQGNVDDQSAPDLSPDEAWLDTHHLPDDDMIRGRIDDWLLDLGATRLGEPHSLEPRDEVRKTNRHKLEKFYAQHFKIVSAWCRKTEDIRTPGWALADDAGLALVQLADSDGQLDFTTLNDAQLETWMKNGGIWPDGMLFTCNPDALGLGPEDIEQASDDAEERHKKREFEKRTIDLNDTRVSAEEANYSTIATIVAKNINDDLLNTSTRSVALEQTKTKGTTRGRTGGSGGGGRDQLNKIQLKAIGLAGEVIAFEWLKRQYPKEANEGCWKSSYRYFVIGEPKGNDSLGFDFQIILKSRTIYYEIKSSTGDTMEIILGETEVRHAQNCASERDKIYRIIYIPYVTNPERTRILPLPNPFSEQGKDRFNLVGSGLKYRFVYAE